MDKMSVITVLGAIAKTKERNALDFYTTPRVAVDKLISSLDELKINLPEIIIEPSVGTGNIANPLIEKGHRIIAYDVVDRGFRNTNIANFLEVNDRPEEPVAIVANFPYKDVLNHTEHSLEILKNGEYLCSLCKIQFLETKSRRAFFDKNPMKYVLVFSERIKCLNGGEETPGSSAICYCWCIWEKGYSGMPMIKWI